ncbi:hypothetical protein D7B24_006605 [Verticillium nonalfalfae]|uniref:Uncharacterized protein n=1 Tax=Verticillium nonalfalfae TaxID=1051616 RepID=A0A3M9Y906_9PEZI|nr:uncharacterized protein D7B24_006605 [Verticillium nonalfalfae]RNJ56959.1 hypothetical protein D7B24_006605 [Verticillium nonalfalfae]
MGQDAKAYMAKMRKVVGKSDEDVSCADSNARMNGNLQTNISDPSHDKSPSDRIACKMVSNAPQLPEASQKCPSLYDALPFLLSLARHTEIIIEVDTDGGLE